MIRRIVAYLAALALAAAALLSPAAPAQAAWSDCPSGQFCMWTGYQGTGSICQYSTYEIRTYGGFKTRIDGCNNNTRSWWNRSGTYNIMVIDGDGCDVYTPYWKRVLQPGQSATGEGSDWNNRISSINVSPPYSLACQGGMA